jgi:RimJ/RimL family protein N-acetyltransferase
MALTIPTLTTTRLRLEPPGPQAAALYQAFYTDAAASAAYGGPLTAEAAAARLGIDTDAWHRQGFGVWVLRRWPQDELVGVCGFWQGQGWPRELTWWLLPAARGQGLALEASQAVLAQAYRVWQWAEVGTYMNDANAAARALVLRLGGVPTGRQRFPDGLARDTFRLPPPPL